MIKRYGDSWGFDFRPDGRSGARIRKRGYKTRIAAVNALRSLERRQVSGVRLSALVRVWYDLHGLSLKDARYRLSRTLAVVDRLGDPLADDFTASDWAEYRAARLKSVSASTVNHEQRYLSAVFSELLRLGHVKDNPLKLVRQVKLSQRELSFLSLDQCRVLLDECKASSNPHCWPVAALCLATGARWGEVESLTHSCVLAGKLLFVDTKSGKSRSVPVSEALLSEVLKLAMPAPGRLFGSCRAAFRSAYGRTGYTTPQQLTHVLRHTFASHFMMNGGDILTLQRILGHGSLAMTMRYAHLSPEHLSSALSFNPLALWSRCGQDVGNVQGAR